MTVVVAHLTAVTELGGQSPKIIDESAKTTVTTLKIAQGKWLNASQTCVAPDYLLVHESICTELVDALKREESHLYGAAEDDSYTVSQRRFERLQKLSSDAIDLEDKKCGRL